jgi:hypothetical protein
MSMEHVLHLFHNEHGERDALVYALSLGWDGLRASLAYGLARLRLAFDPWLWRLRPCATLEAK